MIRRSDAKQNTIRGRSTFSAGEISRIRTLLAEKIQAPRSRQKRLRDDLRDLGFYITDFEKASIAFGPDDLDAAIAVKQITVHN